MGTTRLCSVILLTVVVAVGQSLSVDEIARRQSQLTMDTFRFFEQRLQQQQSLLEERLRYLEARVSDLESRPVVGGRLEGGREGGRGGVGEGGGGGGGEGGRGGGDGGGGRGGSNNEPVDPRKQEPTPEPQEPDPEPQKTTKLVTTLKATTVKPTTPGLEYDRTCAEIYNHGYIYNGEYTIDPDGEGPVSAFTVYCNMDEGEGVTVVGHDSEMENIPVNGFEAPGSFVLEPTYANGVASMIQLGALADASATCTQRVRYACKSSGLMEIDPKTGLTYAWWVDRNGQKRVNFGGAPTDSGKCACAYGGPNKDENTCFMGTETCSCDHKKAKNQNDEGEFDDKDLLPVMSINLGDTGHKKERGAITLGKFICKG